MKYQLLALLFAVAMSFADEAGVQFENANQLYRNADYAKAAAMYEQILANGYESPALYFNLGNAYFKEHNIPAAILNYERARRLAPDDDDVLYNIRLANLRVIDKIEPIPRLFFLVWWDRFVNRSSSDGWGVAMVIGLWIAAFAMASLLFLRSDLVRRILLLVALIAFLGGGVSFVASLERDRIETGADNAIVFDQSVPIKSAPDQQSTDLFVLHEGVKVEVLDEVGSWKKIRLADGKVGWIPDNAIKLI